MSIMRMATRIILNKLIHKGVNAGIDRAYGAEKNPADMTPEERQKHKAARANAKRSKQAFRTIRRFGRF